MWDKIITYCGYANQTTTRIKLQFSMYLNVHMDINKKNKINKNLDGQIRGYGKEKINYDCLTG